MTKMQESRSARRKGGLVGTLGKLAGVAFLLAIVAVIIGFTLVRKYLGGNEFRSLLEQQASGFTGAEVNIQPLQWENLAVRSGGVTAGTGNHFSRVEIIGVSGELTLKALTTGTWVVDGATVDKATIDLKKPKSPIAGSLIDETAVPSSAVSPPPPTPVFNPGLPGWFPQKILIPEIQVRELNARFGAVDQDWRLLGSTLHAKQQTPGLWDVTARRGNLRLSPFPGNGVKEKTFVLRDANLRVNEQSISLLGSQFRADDQCSISMDGTIPRSPDGGAMILNYRVEDLPVSEVLGSEWTDRIFGKLGIVGQSSNSTGQFVHEGQAELVQARFLSPKPVIEKSTPSSIGGIVNLGVDTATSLLMPLLGAYTDRTEQFRNLFLDTAKCRYKMQGEVLEISEIRLRSRGLLGIEGDMRVEGEALSGNLMVGVSRETLSGIPGAEAKVFTLEKDGLLWTPVRVGGTLAKPEEDLTNRIVDAAGARVFEVLPGVQSLDEARKALKDGAGGVIESGTQILDQGGKLLDAVLPFPGR